MQPIRPMLLGLGLLALGLTEMPSPNPTALAQAVSMPPDSVQMNLRQITPVQTTWAQPSPEQSDSIDLSFGQPVVDFFRRDPEDRNRGSDGTSRGEDGVETADGSEPNRYCILNPGRNDTLWHPQPLFLIQGNVTHMEVKEFQPLLRRGIDPPPPLLWSVTPNAAGEDLVKAPFDAAPLEPGTRYEWRIYQTAARSDNSDHPIYILPFRVMPNGPERDQITTDLAQLHTDLVAQGANSATIAVAKATYFLDNEMPADALHILFSIGETDLTPTLTTFQTTLIDTICSEEITS